MKKKFVTLLSIVLVIALFAVALIACQKYGDEENTEEEDQTKPSYTHTVTNGTFYDASSTSAVTDTAILNSVASWTAKSGATTTGNSEKTGTLSAAIDIKEKADFDTFAATYLTINADDEAKKKTMEWPGIDPKTPTVQNKDENGEYQSELEDTNVYVIANTKSEGSLYVEKSSFTLEKNSYYLLQFSVCTLIDAPEGDTKKGAWFILGQGTSSSFAGMYTVASINTQGKWQTYYLFIETNKTTSMSMTAQIWLGYGPEVYVETGDENTDAQYKNDEKDIYATKGVALFDNVLCEKVDADKLSEKLATLKDKDDKALATSEGYAYDKDKLTPNDFSAFKTSIVSTKDEAKNKFVAAKSAYYLTNTNMEMRTMLSSFGATYRKYFYSFRENSGSTNLQKYSLTTSASTLDNKYYGHVDLSNLYTLPKEGEANPTKDNYTDTAKEGISSTLFSAMSYDDWYNVVMNYDNTADVYDLSQAEETFALMIYNKDLAANALKASEKITIEANHYYVVSVWAYVWAKANANGKYYSDYETSSGKSEPSEEPTNLSADDKNVYNLIKDGKLDNLFKDGNDVGIIYTTDLTKEEKDKAAKVETDETKAAIGDYKVGGDNSKTYKTDTIAWLKGETMLNDATLTNLDSLAEKFYYTYLYFVAPEESLDDALKILKANGTLKAFALYERQKRVEEYNNTKQQYDKQKKSHDDWVTAKAEYEDKYTRWENANKNENGDVIPKATVKLTGAGEINDQQTTALNMWQKLTFYVKGSQLSDREVTLELCLGTGTDASTYMLGGVFFDSIDIQESKVLPTGSQEADFTTISEIKDVDQVAYGSLTVRQKTDINEADWVKTMGTGTATSDEKKVVVSFANEEGKTINLGGTNYEVYSVSLTNNIPTSSTLNYTGDQVVTILPNKFYRFAFLAKTTDIDEEIGATINLLIGTTPNTITETKKTVDSFVSKKDEKGNPDWSEVVFYIQGDLAKTYYAGIQLSLGSGGTKYTPESYVKGSISVSAFNCLAIEYSEYSAAATGDVKESGISLYNITTDLDDTSLYNFTNPYYAEIDYSKTDADQFDAEGKLTETGVASTKNWTKTILEDAPDTPTEVKLDVNEKTLSWKSASAIVDNGNGVATSRDALSYEIWMKYTINNTTTEKLYTSIDAIANQENYSVNLNWDANVATYFAVKAVGDQGVSELSSYTTAFLGNGNEEPTPVAGKTKTLAQAGTVENKDALFEGSEYRTPSTIPTIMKLYAPYKSILSMKSESGPSNSSNTGLEKDGYYRISVWAKSEEGTAISIILTGTSGSLNADNELGFVMVETHGQWQEFSFYIKTGSANAKMSIQYSIGNPYAIAQTNPTKKTETFYLQGDLSSGTAYFDFVRVTSITEDQYNEATEATVKEGEKYPSLAHNILYKDIPNYVYTMEYVMDSFDSYTTVNTSSTTDENMKGNSPSDYSHSIDVDLSDNNNQATYGIYNLNSKDEMMQKAIKRLYTQTDDDKKDVLAFNKVFKEAYTKAIAANNQIVSPYDWENLTDENWQAIMNEFLKINREEDGKVVSGGDNVLVMSNKAESGFAQKYSLSSSSYKVAANSFAKITFSARTMIAKVISETETNEAGEAVTKYSYSLDDVYAELRVVPTSGSDKTESIKINSYKYGESLFDDVTYTFYYYNSSNEECTVSWAFCLGDEELSEDEKTENKNPNEFHEYVVGMAAIDLVSFEDVSDKWTVNSFKSAQNAAAASNTERNVYFQYEKKKDESATDNKEEENNEEEEEKESFWDRVFHNEYFWLYISSFVIAFVILITVIVVLIRKWRKKHPKEVVVENVAKTEKDIKVIPTQPQVKEEALEADEYVDEIKPLYVQRVTNNKSRKDRKKGKK